MAISLLTFVPGGMGGTETYARELIPALRRRGNVQVVPVVPENVRGTFDGEVVVDGVRSGSAVSARLAAILAALRLGRRPIAATGADVVHYPFTIMAPRKVGRATVVSLHDTQHHQLPELFSRAERIFRRFAYDRSARDADLVVTISEFSKQGIVRSLGIPADRIRVIPLAVDAAAFTPGEEPREDFVLYPARGWKHKNHATLVRAMELVRERRPGMRLVLTGGALDSLGPMPDWVDVRGLVSLEQLRHLYRTAAVMAFPSRYEGFGMPPLEAMASGCPVASSTAGSLPEACGDAAVYFDPDDVRGMAAAILAAIDRRAELVPLGLARAAEFSWDRCAAAHELVYAEAAALTRRPSAS